ncbi:hypothetical protein [Aeromicrobium sp. CTD01-1L150]|uniref:hypothetical protein n=1 Tax=Aeromicrobium sp. CTD01-1L150 TaxID=3341830 RepID=UPI0035C1790A
MKQPPFPFVLVALVAVMGYLALTEGQAAIRILCAVAAVILAAAAIYQSRPVREPQDPIVDPDVDPDVDPGT